MRTLSRLFAATLCLVVAVDVLASATWARRYSGFRSATFSGYTSLASIETTADRGYVVAGTTANPADADRWDYLVMKLDASGKIAWQKTFGSAGGGAAGSALPTADGGYIVAGSGPGLRVMKLDADGEVLWQKAYERSLPTLRPSADGGYALLGQAIYDTSAQTYTSSLTKLDQDGNVNWTKRYAGVGGFSLLEASRDGGFALAGVESTGSPIKWVTTILKVDPDGNAVWYRKFSAEGERWVRSIQPTQDGGYIVAGVMTPAVNAGDDRHRELWVVKLDAHGVAAWQKALRSPAESWAEAIYPTADGGYILVGWTNFNPYWPTGTLILKLDRSGDIAWQKVFSALDPISPRFVRPTHDGGHVIGGDVPRGAWIAKIDGGGNIEGCGNVTDASLVAIDIDSTVTDGHVTTVAATQAVTSSDLPASVLPISVGELCYPSVPSTGMRAIEYVHAGYGHYFVTASAEEMQALDSGAIPGWTRTRQIFDVFPLGTAGSNDVCRFWSGSTFAPKSSHFYAVSEAECAAVRQNPDWQFEGKVLALGAPLYGFACGEGLIPLYRLYNDGKGGAPNHRYTASSYVWSVMRGQGWIPEGSGVGIVGCVPQQ